MDKLLKAEIFTKIHGFATKEDGMNFIKSKKEIMKFIEKQNIDLEQMHDTKKLYKLLRVIDVNGNTVPSVNELEAVIESVEIES